MAATGLPAPPIAVNVSSIQISRGDILGSVLQALKKYDLPASSIELEITENCIVEHTEQSKRVLQALQDHGINLAIDDFGTGYSSLAYLKQLPINKLKIDRSLIADIHRDRNDEAIARAVIMLGELLELDIVAEGIENSEQQHFILKHGCHIAQGFLFSRPVSADQLIGMLPGGPHLKEHA